MFCLILSITIKCNCFDRTSIANPFHNEKSVTFNYNFWIFSDTCTAKLEFIFYLLYFALGISL